MIENLKAVINNKIFDVEGYSLSLQLYFLLDGCKVGFSDVKEVLRGTGYKEYDYHKNGLNKEIFEGDEVKFFDEFNNILTGEVVWSKKFLKWVIICDVNIHGWLEHCLYNAGCLTIIKRKYE